MNILVQEIITNNHRANALLDEPEAVKNYKTEDGYKAVVNEIWTDYLLLIIEGGRTVDRKEFPF